MIGVIIDCVCLGCIIVQARQILQLKENVQSLAQLNLEQAKQLSFLIRSGNVENEKFN